MELSLCAKLASSFCCDSNELPLGEGKLSRLAFNCIAIWETLAGGGGGGDELLENRTTTGSLCCCWLALAVVVVVLAACKMGQIGVTAVCSPGSSTEEPEASSASGSDDP